MHLRKWLENAGIGSSPTPRQSSSGSANNSPNSTATLDGSLTSLHDETLATELGLSTLEAMNDLRADSVQNRAVREYTQENMRLWKARAAKFGGDDMPEAATADDDMQTVRINSPDNHYHQTGGKGLPNWLKAAAVMLGGGGLAAGGAALAYDILRDKEPPPAATQPDDGDVGLNPGGLKIEVIKAP